MDLHENHPRFTGGPWYGPIVNADVRRTTCTVRQGIGFAGGDVEAPDLGSGSGPVQRGEMGFIGFVQRWNVNAALNCPALNVWKERNHEHLARAEGCLLTN